MTDPSRELREAEIAEMTAAHRDSYPMGNAHHGTPERPDWGTFCVECKESWPCDVSRLLTTLAHEKRKAAEGALREAADELWGDGVIGSVPGWLRARADRIAGDA